MSTSVIRQGGTSGKTLSKDGKAVKTGKKGKNSEEIELVRQAQLQHVSTAFTNKCKALLVEPNSALNKQIVVSAKNGIDISSIEVVDGKLSSRQMWALMHAFKGYSPLGKLSFVQCDLEKNSVKAIAAFFSHYLNMNAEALANAEGLAALPSLANPKLFGHITTNVSYLKLQRCNLDATDAVNLSCVLQSGSTIKELYLDYCPIGSIGALALSKTYSDSKNSSLSVLSLKFCNVESTCTEQLISSLLGSSLLEELYLDGNSLGNSVLRFVSAHMNASSNLNKLGLSTCGMRMHLSTSEYGNIENSSLDSAISSLCSSLSNTENAKQLYFLDLAGNAIGNSNALKILVLLKGIMPSVIAKQRRPLCIPVTERISTDTFKKLLSVKKSMDMRIKRLEKLKAKLKAKASRKTKVK